MATIQKLLSVNQAVKLMHGRDSKCRRLLHEWGVIRDMDGTRVVIWQDVLDKLREGDEDTHHRREYRTRSYRQR